MKMRILGIPEMQAKLRRIAAQYPKLTERALLREAQIEMVEAKRRTPVDVNRAGGRVPPHPGQLRRSGTVAEPVRIGTLLSVELSFGGLASDYAIYVHEIPDAFHPVGQWKYLESTLNESRPYMLQRLAARLHFDSNRIA